MSRSRIHRQHNEFFTAEHVEANRERILTPGMQKIIYLFRTGSFGDDYKEGRGRPALDAGCGSGFNSVTLARLGWDVSAFDITEEMSEQARRNMEQYGVEATVKVGTNQSIPFKDNRFQMLLSTNTIHYVHTEKEMDMAFAEFARVLAPGGRIYLTTTHPENWIFKNFTAVDEHAARLDVPGDYRDGLTLFRFRSEDELRAFAEPYFKEIRIGVDVTEYFNKTIRNYVMTGVCR